MPKLIQPKRLNKNITVEEYWSIRDQLKKTPKSQAIVAYRQDQVANRFRYLKPTEQAKLFNPLGYFFKRSVSGAKSKDDKYDEHFKDQESTFTHEYLSSVRYRVSSPLIPIKKLVFGLKSIIYNHEAILQRLVSHLQCEDSWPLMQAVTRDIKQKSFDFWMKTGLQKLAYQSVDESGTKQSIYSNNFNQSKFQNLFNTLSIIMQANYEQIMLRINEFFTLMNSLFFHHHNKYIRKFSMKCVSYIINNLSLEDNLNLIFGIVISGAIHQQQGEQNEEIPICELLLNRHKSVKGCLSSIEINNVIETLKQLPLFVNKNFQEMKNQSEDNHKENEQKQMLKQQLQTQVSQIISSYIAGIMDLLETKFGKIQENESNEILFDLNYCIKAFIALQQKSESSINQITLLIAFATYLQNCDQKRFLTHNPKHQNYINQTFSLILGYLQSFTIKSMEQKLSSDNVQLITTETGNLIKLSFKICPKQTVKFLLLKDVLHYCKLFTKQQSLEICRQINSIQLSVFDMKETQTIGEFLLMVFRKFFKEYFDNNTVNKIDNEIEEMLYLITIILKRIEFEKKVNLHYLELNKAQLIAKAQQISQINSFILFCKLAMILNFNNNNSKDDQYFNKEFSSIIKHTFDSLIHPFVTSLETILSSDNSELKSESIFAYQNNIKNLLRYSHHEVEWVNVAFSMEECYKQLMRKLNDITEKQEKGFWQDLSLNRIVELDHKQNLNDIFNFSLGLLQSRNRLTRKTVLERIVSLLDAFFDQKLKTIIERLLSIDSDEIDLDNERDIKKQFVTLEQQISTIKSENELSKQVISLITNWVLGFSFTGFKLITDSIVSFTTTLVDLFPAECGETLFPFLSYYIYRHSRQFEFDMNENEAFVLRTPKSVQEKLNISKSNGQFFSLMKGDFNIQNQNTIEWIGLERIALSIGKAKKFKNKNESVKLQLENILKQYFRVEFFRKQNTLSGYKSGSQAPNSHLILQPKTRFLSVMLKLCPETYLPPYECLHYVAAEYFCLQSTHIIKKNRWQALWVKKLKGSKSKQEINDTVNTTIALQKMSMPEQQLYAHFLWKQLLEASQQKRRTIFEHIRDRVPEIIPYIFNNIFYKEMLFVSNPEQYFLSAHVDQRFLAELKERLAFENKKTLLNMMYLLKAMIVVFKNFLRDSVHMRNVVCVLRCLIRLVYEKAQVNKEKKNDEEGNNQDEENDEENQNEQYQQVQYQQQEQGQRQEKDSFQLYKAHRKQLYKVLTEVFTHFTIDYDQADYILSDLSHSYLGVYDNFQIKDSRIFSKIAYASVNSVPGILILLKVVSQEVFYHHLLIKFGVLDLVASIVDINDFENSQQHEGKMEQQQEAKSSIKKKQSNPHAINTCIDILSNILNISHHSNNKMTQQSEQQIYFENHWFNWTTQLSNLLKSINHYFLFSKNLSEKSNTNNKSSYAELDYYSSENKQNLKSIQNNRNRSKKEMSNHQHEGKNLDLMWEIVGKIVCLGNNATDQQKKQGRDARVHLSSDWEQIFWGELNKLMKVKQFKDKQFFKLFKIIEICLIYFDQQLTLSDKNSSNNLDIESFLCKIISVLPHINQLSDRIKLTEIINKGIKSTCRRQHINLIDEQVIATVGQINSVKKNGLNIEIDYDQFFGAIGKYCLNADEQNKEMIEEVHEVKKTLNLLSHQYIIYNLLPYLTSEELSVRKAVREALNSFLIKIAFHLENQQKETLKVYNSVLRLLIQQLKRNEIDNVFWSIFGCIGLFVRFQVNYSDRFAKMFENEMLFKKMFKQLTRVQQSESLTFESQSEEDFFHMITSISQGNKMKALRMLKEHCIKLKQESIRQKFKQQEKGSCLPHPLPLLLPVLQHLILPTKHFTNQHQYNVQGNLTSTLTHISLEIYEVIIPFARESLIKKELKRLSTKIKFNEQQKANEEVIKKNILVIKIISSIVEGIDTLQKCTGNIKKYITDYGFDEFHSKLIQNARTLNQQQQEEESDNQQEEEEDKKKIEFAANLQELESEQAINRNFMLFDRKLLEMQEKQKQEQQKNGTYSQSSSSLINFLKLHILIPFKLMLFYENKSTKEAKQEEDKSRMMISVAITKLLIKFPMDMFLFEFQKILSKICRLLKKRKLEIRENGRKSLCQIAKIVGPQMLYAIVLELKFHLRDNFQKHIFNYTAYEIIQSLSPLNQGELDYCLPLILPMIVDEMFGQAMEEKKMVESNEVPVLNMETKKKKGHELLILITKQISIERIRYLIEYLEKFLKQYLNSQANLSKYEIMVNNLTNGLGHNQQFVNPQNSGYFGQILCDSMYQLRKQIKIYNFEQEKNKIVNDTTLKINTQKSKKVGKQSLLLQQQAGRNGSIFKKMTKQVYEKRTQQIMINCLVQFYLAIGSLLIKKQVISLKTLDENSKLAENFIKIMQFVFECMDHRDNRIVCKSMRMLHQALIINYDRAVSNELKESTKSLRKKVSRKILLFIEKLTSSDAQLLKESFVILIDLFTQVTITKEFLPSIITIIKLHTNNENDEANIPEPYRLLKLIIYKLPESIYDSLVYQMYEMVRINLVNSVIKQIRDCCRQIASTYVKSKEYLLTGLQLSHNMRMKQKDPSKQKHKKQLQKTIEHEYKQRIQKQLTFYLSNLECKREQNQQLVLQIIQQWINNRTKQQIQQVSQLVVLTLATSLVNGNECVDKVTQIIHQVLKIINKGKIYEIVEKCLVWVGQQREKSMIRECGYFLLYSIVSTKSIQIDNITVRTQYLLKPTSNNNNNLLDSLLQLLNEQCEILNEYISAKKAQKQSKNSIHNKQWSSIINSIDTEQVNPYLNENRILCYAIDLLTCLVQSTVYQQKIKLNRIVYKVWHLLKVPMRTICAKSVQFLEHVDLLAVHLASSKELHSASYEKHKAIAEQQQSINTRLDFNFRATISTLINNEMPKQVIDQLLKKFIFELQTGEKCYIELFLLLSSLLTALVTKFKAMEQKAETIYYLLTQRIIKDEEKNVLIFKNQQHETKMIDSLGKVSRNQFVSVECKTLNEQALNLVKEIVGTNEFYRKLTKLQSQRREKKSQQKATLARLAVTDQKAYQDAKAKKKVKTNNL